MLGTTELHLNEPTRESILAGKYLFPDIQVRVISIEIQFDTWVTDEWLLHNSLTVEQLQNLLRQVFAFSDWQIELHHDYRAYNITATNSILQSSVDKRSYGSYNWPTR